jgi:signal transduction histidine kinase
MQKPGLAGTGQRCAARVTWRMHLRSFAIGRNRRVRPQRGVIVLSAALIAAYGASTFWSLQREHDQALQAAGAALESMARSAETGTDRSLFEIDAMLIGIERIVGAVLPTAPLDGPAVKTVLGQFNDQSLAVSDILILDAAGKEVNRANASAVGARSYRERAFFSVHRPRAAPELFIGDLAPHPADGGSAIMLSRPLMRDGVRLGVIAAEVPVATFTELYASITANGDARIALLLDSGALAAGRSDRGAAIGGVTASAPAVLAAAARNQAGLIETPADAGEGEALRAYRRVSARPLIVTAVRDRGEILRRWYRERNASLAEFALFAATVGSLAWLAVRALRASQSAAAYLRRSEARLKRQSSLLQSTLESMGEGLSVFDARGRLSARNRRFCELLDLPDDLAFGVPLREILTRQAVRGDFGDREPQAEVARRLEQFYHDVPTVKERVTHNSRILQIRRSAMPDGAVVSVYSDITDFKAGEHKLLQARSQAELANHSKSEFLANMSHELRTPLNAVIGFTEIIAQELFGPIGNEKYLEYIKDVHTSSLHLLSIINDVLDMSKIEAGKLELEKEAVTLQHLIADVIRIVHERASSRAIALLAESADDPVVIWADERAMKQIFLNLLSNAIKFSEDGGKVHIRVTAEQADFAVIEVEDHGIGMDIDEQERALQPFGQAKPATTRNYGGTGLGLPITKGLVEAHDGTLTISSHPGEGTTVRLILPTQPESPIFAGTPATRSGAVAVA